MGCGIRPAPLTVANVSVHLLFSNTETRLCHSVLDVSCGFDQIAQHTTLNLAKGNDARELTDPWRADSIRCARKAFILPSRLWLHHSSGYEAIVPIAYAEYLEARNASIFVIKKFPERNQIGVPPSHRPKTEAEEHQN